jgi:hypothetical protein
MYSINMTIVIAQPNKQHTSSHTHFLTGELYTSDFRRAISRDYFDDYFIFLLTATKFRTLVLELVTQSYHY